MKMKITVLIENRVARKGLIAEHGLSYLIEKEGVQVLFDMGASEQFSQNANALGYNIATVDAAVLSHGHNDHSGGLVAFIQQNDKTPIYLKKEAVFPKYKADRFIGMDPKINSNQTRFNFVSEPVELVAGVYIFPNIAFYFPSDKHVNQFFTVNEGKDLIADQFDDELFLVIKSDKNISIVSSCSHKGITNMVETARNHFKLPVDVVIGGFHLKDEQQEATKHILEYFKAIQPRKVFTGHCTGIDKYVDLKSNSRIEFEYMETGTSINLN